MTRLKRAAGMAQEVERLPSKWKPRNDILVLENTKKQTNKKCDIEKTRY
jgi:hypothetical protein